MSVHPMYSPSGSSSSSRSKLTLPGPFIPSVYKTPYKFNSISLELVSGAVVSLFHLRIQTNTSSDNLSECRDNLKIEDLPSLLPLSPTATAAAGTRVYNYRATTQICLRIREYFIACTVDRRRYGRKRKEKRGMRERDTEGK